MKNRFFSLLLWIPLSLALVIACGNDDDDDRSTNADGYFPSATNGPFQVGNLTFTFVDSSRDEMFDPGAHRTLITEVWYPVESAGHPNARLIDFWGDEAEEVLEIFAVEYGMDLDAARQVAEMEVGSVGDQPIAGGGPFPAVVLSHGANTGRYFYHFLCERLASQGFVVIAADHTGSANATRLPSGVLPYQQGSIIQFDMRVGDVRFLIDMLEAFNQGQHDSRFSGKIDLDRIGLTGHSLGAVTTLRAVAADSRIKAAAPMAGPDELAEGVSTPMLHFFATEDEVVNDRIIRESYERSEGPRWYIGIEDGGHMSFTEQCAYDADRGDGCGDGERRADESPFTFIDPNRSKSMVAYYESAFFGYFLKGAPEYLADLKANPFGPDLLIEYVE